MGFENGNTFFSQYYWRCRYGVERIGNSLPRKWCSSWGASGLKWAHKERGRWRGRWQLVRCTNQRWGSRVQTHQKYILSQWFVEVVSLEKTEDKWVLPWHHCLSRLNNSRWFTSNLTKISQNIFTRKCSSDDWSNGPIRLQYMPLVGQTFHPYSRF